MLFAFGSNGNGQLGVGHTDDCLRPTLCPEAPQDIQSIVGGGNHTLLLRLNGQLCAAGALNACRCSATDIQHSTVYVPVSIDEALSPVTGIACGWEHSLIAVAGTQGHGVVALGGNRYSQRGLVATGDGDADYGSQSLSLVTCVLKSEMPIVCVAAGLRTSCAITARGDLFSWGCNRYNQLSRRPPTCTGEKLTTIAAPTRLPDVAVCAVACGQRHTIAVDADKCTLHCYGDNRFGQLGPSHTKLDDDLGCHYNRFCLRALSIAMNTSDTACVQQLGTGWSHSAVLLSDGRVYTWGRGDRGQLGVQLPDSARFSATPILVPLPAAAVQIAVGSEHTLALLVDGRCVAWGWNEHGNCGTGDTQDVYAPTVISLPVSGTIRGIGSGYGTSFVWT